MGQNNQHINSGAGWFVPAVSMCLNAGAMGRQDAESETLIPTIGGGFDVAGCEFGPSGGKFVDVNPTLDARAKDGPIRNQLAGAVLAPVSIHPHCIGRAPNAGPQGKEYLTDGTAYCLTSAYGTKWNGNASADNGSLFAAQPVGVDTYNGVITGDLAATISARNGIPDATGPRIMQAVAFQERGREHGRELEIGGDVAYALTAPNGGGRAQERNVMTSAMQVRRLTPRECERLQGFPDDYTAIPWRGKLAGECPDGPRYKALGNSWAVPVVRWIGRRIADALA